LAHVAQFIIGLAGPVVFNAGPSISALWFPPEQRTTATAIATIAGFAGSAGCFIFGMCLCHLHIFRGMRGTVVARRSVTGELSMSYARPAADG